MIEYQSFLARLYTDDVFRMLNRVSPDSAQSFFVLEQRDRDELRALNLDDVEAFAGSLSARLRERVHSMYPVTAAAMGPDRFERASDRFRSLHGSHPSESRMALATAFGHYLEDFLCADTSVPDWLSELARFEQKLVEASVQSEQLTPMESTCHCDETSFDALFRLRHGVRLDSYEFDVVALQGRMKAGVPWGEVSRCTTHVVVAAAHDSRRPTILKLSALSARLLDLTRTPTDVDGVVRRLALEASTAISPAQAVAALEQFLKRGLLTRMPSK